MWFLIAVVVVAAFVMRALMPKQDQPKPQDIQTPVADEGGSVRKVYGTVWISDPVLLAFQKIGTDRIRSKGGKK